MENFETKIRNEALSWIFEMEFLNNKQAQNALILNIIKISSSITDVNYLIDQHQKKMLIYLELTRWGSWFRKKSIELQVIDILTEVLPDYRFRVVFERSLFERAIEGLSSKENR